METGAFVRLLLTVTAATAAAAAAAATPKDVGDACKNTDDDAGTCRPIGDCDVSNYDMRKGLAHCFFDDDDKPVVCCPAPAPASATAPTARLLQRRAVQQRVATRMCTKYAESVYRNNGSGKVDQCGLGVVPQITGPIVVTGNEFPHMALLGFGDKQEPDWACAGSLISERFVLTAAHCISSPEKGTPKIVRLGKVNLRINDEFNKHEDFAVAEAIVHPDYKNGVFYNDIGLLRLARDVTFTASIRPACVQTVKDFESTNTIASGWGRSDWTDLEMAVELTRLKMPVLDTQVCVKAYKTVATTKRLEKGIDEESMLCVGSNNHDACRSDAGGPLQVVLQTPYCMHSVVGITSFGKGTCAPPSVYTRVSHYVPWIENVVWPNEK